MDEYQSHEHDCKTKHADVIFGRLRRNGSTQAPILVYLPLSANKSDIQAFRVSNPARVIRAGATNLVV
jgi:hypothetical protein